jgi:hypothetical protein
MTDKDLKKLKRTELLEMLIYLRKELDTTKQENSELKNKLEELQKSQISKENLDKIMLAVEKVLTSD